MTLPNGVVVSHGYDAASRLASMSYAKGGVALGDLSYSYDAAGRRIAMGGSLARVNLPVAVASMGYDAANRMTSRGLNTLTYDANGNLTGDGTNSYTWNARDQLSGMTGASFAYDAGGRRRSKTVGGTGTSFLYDGANAVQETGGAGTANVLGGLGMDEMFQRTDAGGTRSFQTDGLGSVLGLMDGAGTVTTAYTYEAFGGAAAANSAGFTGRENNGTGLMFYRARYYSPGLQRFISEDPLGFGGGDVNLYAYVGNGPTNATDPTGEFAFGLGAFGFGVGFGVDLGLQLLANGGDLGCVNWSSALGSGILGLGLGLMPMFALAGPNLLLEARTFGYLSKLYWGARGGAAGMSLDHFFISQYWGARLGFGNWINASWNLLVIPSMLNSMLGWIGTMGGLGFATASLMRILMWDVVAMLGLGAWQLGTTVGQGANLPNKCGCN